MDKDSEMNEVLIRMEVIQDELIEMSKHYDSEDYLILKKVMKAWHMDLSHKMEKAFLGKDNG